MGRKKIKNVLHKKMRGQTILYFVALFLIVVGALNWGYISYTQSCDDDLVNAVFPGYARWIYAAIGLSGIALALLILQRNSFNQGDALQDVIQGAVKSGKKGFTAVRKRVY
jgi:uncharacterized membrane protein YuzA (DUF378 family)